jgi:hypothetical protein
MQSQASAITAALAAICSCLQTAAVVLLLLLFALQSLCTPSEYAICEMWQPFAPGKMTHLSKCCTTTCAYYDGHQANDAPVRQFFATKTGCLHSDICVMLSLSGACEQMCMVWAYCRSSIRHIWCMQAAQQCLC